MVIAFLVESVIIPKPNTTKELDDILRPYFHAFRNDSFFLLDKKPGTYFIKDDGENTFLCLSFTDMEGIDEKLKIAILRMNEKRELRFLMKRKLGEIPKTQNDALAKKIAKQYSDDVRKLMRTLARLNSLDDIAERIASESEKAFKAGKFL